MSRIKHISETKYRLGVLLLLESLSHDRGATVAATLSPAVSQRLKSGVVLHRIIDSVGTDIPEAIRLLTNHESATKHNTVCTRANDGGRMRTGKCPVILSNIGVAQRVALLLHERKRLECAPIRNDKSSLRIKPRKRREIPIR
jgi:hypothetical protein